MKKLSQIFGKINAYLVFWFTGWRSVEYFGVPDEIKHWFFIVCFKNGTVMEMNYRCLNKKFYRYGFGDELPENPVLFWRKLPKAPHGY